MTDDALDQDLGRELRSFSSDGIRPIDPRVVAETAILRNGPRPFTPVLSPAPRLRIAGTLAIALVAVAVVALVANLQRGTSQTGAASPVPATPQLAPTATLPALIPPGLFDISTPAAVVHLTVPLGWRAADQNRATYLGDEPYPANGPMLAVQDVTSVVADACPFGPTDPTFVPVGPSVEDLVMAIEAIAGVERVGPTDVQLDGHPAKRIVLSMPPDFERRCGGGEGRFLWKNATVLPFGLLNGGTATVYVVDVDGMRLVIVTHYRGATTAEQLELGLIVASIDIDSSATEPIVALRPEVRYPLNADGIGFSFEIPTEGWEQFGRISLNKSFTGGQAAEAMLYWSAFPEGRIADPCQPAFTRHVGTSASDLAAAVASAPGTEVVEAPSDVEVGGRPATSVVIKVREENGCDPGFFYAWDDYEWGALWPRTGVGSTIRVWIVDVDGTRLFIGGASAEDAGPDLEQELEWIVESIRFD